MSVVERIKILISLERNKTAFAEKIDVERATISYIANKANDVSANILTQVALSYTNLNCRWLLTGEGDMWTDGAGIARRADIKRPAVSLTEAELKAAKEQITDLALRLAECYEQQARDSRRDK